jgi:hypothetical protein
MSIRDFFVQASYWGTQALAVIFLVWVGLRIFIVLKRFWSQLSGGIRSQGAGTAGSGRNRIGPRD